MLPQKFFYFFKRFFEMGPVTALWIMRMRFKKRLFVWRSLLRFRYAPGNEGQWRSTHTSSHDVTPAQAGAQTGYLAQLGMTFFYQGRHPEQREGSSIQNNVCSRIFADTEFQQSLPAHLHDKQSIYALADTIAQNKITILGFGTFDLTPLENNWHRDITTNTPSPDAWRTAFYTNITIPSCAQTVPAPDIKVPWEISRFGHLFTLGLGYQHACQDGDTERSARYSDAFQKQVSNWQQHNPFLIGVNWANPMEVAIRSINFIWAHSFFASDQTIEKSFWQSYIAMLCEHATYLEHNQEVSDKPNNHYIADLVGLLYLTTILVDIKKYYQKHVQILKQLITQFEHQIFPDHTSYEGSTSYHRLVTEMLMHTILLCKYPPSRLQRYGVTSTLPESLYQHYVGMKQFLADCTDAGGNFVQIGDNDGGVIVAGLGNFSNNPEYLAQLGMTFFYQRRHPEQSEGSTATTTYPHFGLSIIKSPRWHITFRHPTYQHHQPTGHFHNDQLSVTVSIDGMPLLIDPGTYRYTSDATMRNALRDFPAHNTFFAQAQVNAPALREHLFALERGEQHSKQFHRQLMLDQTQTILTITDWIENASQETQITWTLNFAPEWEIENKSPNSWLIKKENKIYAVISTTQHFKKVERFFSPTYGLLVPTVGLEACMQSVDQEKLLIQIFS